MNELDDFIVYLLIGVVAGARIFNFVFYNPSVFWRDPLEILKIWHGGLSFHGGLIGAAIAIWLFCRQREVRFLDIADALVIPTALALGFGRIGNFTNQELVGTTSNLPWCVKYMAVDGVCRHPYQIYAALSHFLLFGILLWIYRKQKKSGQTFWSFVLLYGVLRIITDIFREEIKFFNLISTGQILCLAMVITGSYFLFLRKISHSQHVEQG